MTITVYELGGTHRFAGLELGAAPSYFPLGLNSNFTWRGIEYPAETYPMGPSVATGKAKLISAINSTPGQFVLVGTSQGAIVTSQVYNEIRYGSLTSRRADFLYGATFGNPMRQRGHTFPGCPNRSGHGIYGTRLTDTETLWWDFANPGDPACTTGDDLTGRWTTALFDAIYTNYDGTAETLFELVTSNWNVLLDGYQIAQSITNLFYGALAPGSPHQSYGVVAPIPGDTRSSIQIALDQINSLAPEPAPVATVAPPWFTGAPVSVTGWWPILYGDFALTVTPQLTMVGAPCPFTLTVTPSIGMAAAVKKAAEFTLTVTPTITATGVGTPGTSSAHLDLRLTPTLGFRAAQLKTFALTITPSLGMDATVNPFTLTLTPTLTMAAAPKTACSFGLALTPALGVDAEPQAGTSTASFGLAVHPALGMQAAPIPFRLTLTPALSMSAAPRQAAQFGLTLTPAITAAAAATSTAGFQIALTPAIGVDAAATSTASFGLRISPQLVMALLRADFTLTVTPQLGFDAAMRASAAFALTVTPQLGAQPAARVRASFGLTVTPQLSVRAAYVGAFGLTVTPAISMTGSGPVAPDVIGTGNAGTSASAWTLSWTHTPSAAANCVIAVVSIYDTATPLTATYGGVAMTLLSQNYRVAVFYLKNPPTGLQSVNVSIPAGVRAVGNSLSLIGAGTIGTAIRNPNGTNDSGVHTVTVPSVPARGLAIFASGWAFASTQPTLTGGTTDFFASNGANNSVLGAHATGTGSNITFTTSNTSQWGASIGFTVSPQ